MSGREADDVPETPQVPRQVKRKERATNLRQDLPQEKRQRRDRPQDGGVLTLTYRP
mgnify:CR=1 FL=1